MASLSIIGVAVALAIGIVASVAGGALGGSWSAAKHSETSSQR